MTYSGPAMAAYTDLIVAHVAPTRGLRSRHPTDLQPEALRQVRVQVQLRGLAQPTCSGRRADGRCEQEAGALRPEGR